MILELLGLMLASSPEASASNATAAAPIIEPAKAQNVAIPKIPDGTEVKLILDETLTSKSHVKGDLFKLKVTESVMVDNVEVLPQGTIAIGEITRAQTKSAFGVSGKLEARLLYAKLPNGTLRLSGKLGQRGKGGTTETVLTYAIIGSISFVVTGKSAEIPAGTELVARIGEL